MRLPQWVYPVAVGTIFSVAGAADAGLLELTWELYQQPASGPATRLNIYRCQQTDTPPCQPTRPMPSVWVAPTEVAWRDWVSIDWGAPVSKGTWANDKTSKTVTFPAKTGRYLRLIALREVNGDSPMNVAELVIQAGTVVVPRTQMRVMWVDSEEADGYDRNRAIDGDPTTFWHTAWRHADPPLPHILIVDLGGTYDVTRLTYTPRQDSYTVGNIADYEVYVSAGARPSSKYCYAVTASNNNDESALSDVVCASVQG